MVGSNLANVGNFNADNGPNVNDWNRDKSNVNIGDAFWIVSSIAWWILSNHQASCLFPATWPEARYIFCLLLPDCPYLILKVFLKGLA